MKKTLQELGIKDGDTVSIIAIEDTHQSMKPNYIMKEAQLVIHILNSGEFIPMYDVDFENETNKDLIRELEKIIDCDVHLVFDKKGT